MRTSTTELTGRVDGVGRAEFAYLRRVVEERASIVLEDDKEYLVSSRLRPVLRDAGLPSLAALVSTLRRDPGSALADRVVDAMTTNETSFFRDLHPFEVLSAEIVPSLLAERPASAPITVWSAACSSGQEPYSLAITLLEHVPQLDPARVRIVATDLSPTMVERCRAGRYSQLEINRGMPARLLVRYFEQDGDEWVVRPEVRSLVEVHELNLTGRWDVVPRCDVVLMRNVLIYFGHDTRREVLRRVRTEVLHPGGHLMLGAGETTLNVDEAWLRHTVGRVTCYRAPGPEGRPRPSDEPGPPGRGLRHERKEP